MMLGDPIRSNTETLRTLNIDYIEISSRPSLDKGEQLGPLLHQKQVSVFPCVCVCVCDVFTYTGQ